jgi:serine/threonine protein kinase
MNLMDRRYTLGEPLGRGGVGVVYRAFDHLEGEYVALKRMEVDPIIQEIHPLAASPRYQHMLLAHEFRTLASLRHPNIISVLDYGFTSERQPFFVMELLETPKTILEAAQGLDTTGKVDLLIQMLQALIYLHHHKILHRDLKPNNVLVNQAGQVKVLDFGLAVKQGDHQEQAGTIHYMAPEVLNGESAVIASDLYAVGIIAYEMFTGERPFKGTLQRELSAQIVSSAPDMTPFVQLMEADPTFSEIYAVVACLLEKQPENRYSEALTLTRLLCQITDQPLPPDEGPVRESFLQAAAFVGREREMEELQWALTQVKDGHGSAWLVSGESGIGKSRLLDELRIHALTEGFTVLRGQIAEGNDLLGRCWAEILCPLLLAVPISESEASVLKVVVPDIDARLGIELPDETESYDDNHLYSVIAQIVSRVDHPTLVLLEDLQWATESLEPLKMLIPLLRDLPVLVVGSYRSEEAPDLPAQLYDINLIKLERLSYDDIATLSSSMLGSVGDDPQILEQVYKETEGNAFFIVEVIRAWAEEAGHLSNVGQVELPETVLTGGIRNIIQRRLNRVPTWAYGGLQVAAVVGRKLDLDLLNKILSPIFSLMTGDDISVSVSTVWRENRGLNINDWLLVCADAAILEVHEGDWRFTHDKLREQLLADLNSEQMRLLHRQIKKAAEALSVNAERTLPER